MSKSLLGGARRPAALVTSVALLAQLISFVPPAQAIPPIPQEVITSRTAYSRVFDNGDGTFKFESYAEPIHYEDEATGRFEPIDSNLVPETNPARKGWRNRANQFDVSLPAELGDEWVSIESSAGSVACRPASMLPLLATADSVDGAADTIKRNTVSYKDGFGPGVTLEYASLATGLKETIILDKYRGRNVFTFDLDTGGLTPSMTEGGGIALCSAESTTPVFMIAAPYMEDSATNDGDEPARSEDVTYVLRPNGANWTLSVVADEKWLSSSERVYPVKIDPTFFTIGFGTAGDSYVTNAYPTTNYGSSTELKVGYYPGAGENYAYVMPYVGTLMDLRQYASVQILNANMNMYCSHRYDYGSGTLNYGAINGSWGELSLTWNNQPYATYYGQGTATYLQRTRFAVGTIVQSWMDTGVANGIAFWAPVGGQTSNWTKFSSRETANGPVFECAFTTRPKVTCSVSSDAPSAAGPVVSWTRNDFMYSVGSDPFVSQPQIRAEIEVRREGSNTVVYSQTVQGAATSAEVSGQPTGGWTTGRYYARVRVVTDVYPSGYTSTSDWTPWQPFEVRPLTQGSDGAGIEAYRASDSAGGATVDLATGRLLLSRTDFAASALGGALGASFVYDSALTTDTSGAGTGWRVSMPSLGFDDQAAPNPGFEEGSGTGCPTGWTPLDATYVSRSSTYRNGAYSLKLSRPAGSYGTAVAYHSATASSGLSVVPGQRVDVTAWARTAGFTRYSAAGGVFAQVAYFDEFGTYISTDYSSVLIEANTPAGVGWRKVAVASVAPANARKAQLGLAMTNSCGTVYFDDVYFATGAMRLTDADGTSRLLAQTGGGSYMRDPLAGTLALKRTNVARGIVPTLVGTGGVIGASTDGSYAITTSSGYDYVVNGTGTSLTYNLGEAKVLSEATLFLWDGAATGETIPREHMYKLQYSTGDATGPYVDLTGTITGARSWQTHYFAPVKAQYFRVLTIDSTSGAFVLCELELPVTTLCESPVGFDENKRITGIADTSGNIITYSYDAGDDLHSAADSQGRHLDFAWSAEQLSSVNWTGIGSESTTSVTENGVVTYVRDPSNLLVRRKADDGSYVTMAAYGYTGGRITSVTDADGVSAQVAYDENGRVSTITRSSESTPTVTTYDYSVTNQVTITTAGGGQSVSRRVAFSPELGCQVTSTIADPSGEAITTTYAYDSYGHVKSVTDALGRIDTYKSDAHGNVTESVINSTASSDALKLTSSATYTNDRVASTTDAKGNQSFSRYDAKWRPVSSTVAVASDAASGTSSSEETYDGYGNVLYGELPGSSVANLLKNGTFETNVLPGGTGWTLYGSVLCVGAPPSQPNLGYLMVKGGSGTPWIESGNVSVTQGETYIASAWSTAGGRMGLSEYNAAGQWLRRITLASPPAGDGITLMPVSALYTPAIDAASVRFEIGLEGNAIYDNARLEKAYAAGPDSFIDNDSVERLGAGGVPESWARYYSADAVGDTVVIGSERVLRLYGGSATSDAWWESAPTPVTAGQVKRFGVTVASDGLSPGSGWAGVEVVFFTDYGCSWETAKRVRITGEKSMSGTTAWTPYSVVVEVPANYHWVKICPQIGHTSGSLYADHLTMEQVTARESYAYDATHTYRTETTQRTGAKVGAEYDSRGRTAEVTHANPGSGTETVETARTYDGFERLTRVETAPGSSIDDIVAEFAYTPAGRLESVTDPLNHTTTIAYDEGRIAGVTTPSGITTAMTYDGLGRLATTTAPYRTGQSARTLLEYAYDAVGRATSTTYYAKDSSVAATQSATYDDLSRPNVVTWTGPEAQGSLDYTYDPLGRTTGLTSTGPAGTVDLTSTYDKASLPLTTSFAAFGLSAFTITNTFAKTGQWQKTSTANSQEWAFTFGTDGTFRRAASALSSRGLVYNTALKLDRVRLATTNNLFTAEEALTYDGYGRIAGSTMAATGTDLDADNAYTYDAAGRLKTWTLDGATTTYDYDAAGNLTGIVRPGAEPNTTFGSDVESRLTAATTAGVVTTYASDDFGRRISESSSTGETAYTWNSLGRLTSVTSEDTTSTYEYGPSGMRERVTVESAEGTATTEAVWVGGRLLAERDGDGTLYRYLYGPNGLPLEMIVTSGTTTNAYTYQCDRAGSVVALTNSSGVAVATYTYNPWGEPIDEPSSGAGARNPLRYRGYYYDCTTGHYYLPARYYDPAVARFLSPDPAPPSAGDPLTLNRYAYCVGDSVNKSDPSGAAHLCDGGAGPNQSTKVMDEAAYASTVYGVTSWTASNSPEQMGPGMYTLLGFYESEYGAGGPPHVTHADVSIARRWAGKPALASGSLVIADVLFTFYTDNNVSTPLCVTGGVMTTYTLFDDGALLIQTHPYLGLCTPSWSAAKFYGYGDVDMGPYAEVAGGYGGGAALYKGLGRNAPWGVQVGATTPGAGGSLYGVLPATSSLLVNSTPGTWYGEPY